MLQFLKRHLAIIVVALIVLIGLFVINKDDPFEETQADDNFEQQIEFLEQEVEMEAESLHIEVIVDVKGEVKNPGVYEMKQDARVTDVISSAGGFTEHADETFINLAQKVQDEMVIIVPKEGEEMTVVAPVDSMHSDSDGTRVNINNATLEEVQTLSGIGPKKAQAIIDHRDEFGPFQTVEELTEVGGIGEKTLENIKDSIVIP